MSRKHCNRKVHPLTNPFVRLSPLRQEAMDDLQLRELTSLESFVRGTATRQEFCDLKAFIDLTRTAAQMGIGPEALQACKTAQDALIDAARRHESTGKFGLTGGGILALREVMAYADAQRRAVNAIDYQRVVQKTMKEARQS